MSLSPLTPDAERDAMAQRLGSLFTDRDFERVDDEIEEALRGYDGHRRRDAEFVPPHIQAEIQPAARASSVPVDLDVPEFLLRRERNLPVKRTASKPFKASMLHLCWLIPLAAYGIGAITGDRTSAVGYFLAPAAVWLVVALISGMMENSGLSELRNVSALMQYTAAAFVGTIAIETNSFGIVELSTFSTATVIMIVQMAISAFSDDEDDGLPPARPGKRHHRDRFARDLPPIRTANDGMGLRIL